MDSPPLCVEIGADSPLCSQCVQFRNIDIVFSHEFDLHDSFDELCISAVHGCPMCVLLEREIRRYSYKGPDPISEQTRLHCQYENYLKSMTITSDTTIMWVCEVFTESCDTVLPCRAQPISFNSQSRACSDLADKWLKDCMNDHPICRTPDSILPTRVIDVSLVSGSSLPRLKVISGEIGSWVTLSHCWGDGSPPVTTLATLEQRRLGISLQDIPPLFRDAITITKDLGFQYLWIDSLCIVQDCAEDWARESAKMHRIYSEAALCISAAAATGSHEGIFASGNKKRAQVQPFVTISCIDTASAIGAAYSLRYKRAGRLEHEPLHSRAWVLQESILAPRRLDYSSNSLRWTCRTTDASEGDFIPKESRMFVSMADGVGDLFAMPIQNLLPASELSIYPPPLLWWYRNLGTFSRRGITKQNDLLPAIAGIATKIKERTGYTYICGLWVEDLHRGLLWRADHTVPYDTQSDLPSWSWASVHHPASLETPDMMNLLMYCKKHEAQVIAVDVKTADNEQFGPVLSAKLTLRGNYQLVEHRKDDIYPHFNESYSLPFGCSLTTYLCDVGSDQAASRIHCHLDTRTEPPTDYTKLVQDGVVLFQICASLRSETIHEEHKILEQTIVYVLMLKPTGRKDEYRRVGMGLVPGKPEIADGWDMKTVTIV